MSLLAEFVLLVLVVDLIGGCLHWLEDSYGSPETPLLGRHVIEPNIVHHKHPMEFTKSSFLDRNLITMCLAGCIAGCSYLVGALTPAWAAALTLGSMSNQIHFYAHLKTRDVPKVIQLLQRWQLLQSRDHHVGGHHGQPFNRCYCVLTNFVNPVVDDLQLWRRLEWLIWRLTGVSPRDRPIAAV